MRVRANLIGLMLAATMVGIIGGCSQFYNGALGGRDHQAVQEYQQFKDQQQAQLDASRGQRQHEQAARLRGVTGAAFEDDRSADGAAPSGQALAMNTADPAAPGRSILPMQLFGHLPQPDQARSSSMDTTDGIVRVSFSTEGGDFDPDIDPTGQWLVYASTRHRKTSDLYLKRVDGTAVTQLTADPANDVMPAFSPDGRRVAFASNRAGQWDIYIVDVEGGQPVQITHDLSHDIHPSWSPDGKHLVYCSFGTQSGQWELVLVNVENPAQKKFIGYGLLPHWSPVDNRIVFQRARERGTRWFSVWTIELDERGEARRPTEIFASANAAVITPRWSPDGKHVVFCTVIDPGADDTSKPVQADVWIGSADGRTRANLTRSRFANLQPIWGPDGTVFFVSDRAQTGVDNIWALRPDHVLRLARPADESDRAAPEVRVPTP